MVGESWHLKRARARGVLRVVGTGLGQGWQLLIIALLPSLDLVEFGQRSFKFAIEEPHRIKNFAEGRRCFCPVSLPKGEDAIVAQISQYRRIRNLVLGQVA